MRTVAKDIIAKVQNAIASVAFLSLRSPNHRMYDRNSSNGVYSNVGGNATPNLEFLNRIISY